MKTPDKMLFEYASDSVTCFHGHKLTWAEFCSCCEDFFKRNYGIRNCYWRLLEANGFSDAEVRAFRALDCLENELDNVLLDPAFKLNMFFKERLAGFVDPKNLLRFEREDEALARVPKPDYEGFLALTDAQKEAAWNLFHRRKVCTITRLAFGEHTVEFKTQIRDNERTEESFKPTRTIFKKYLEILSGLTFISAIDSVGPSCPPVLRVRAEATPGKIRKFEIKLLSLTKCTVEECDAGGFDYEP